MIHVVRNHNFTSILNHSYSSKIRSDMFLTSFFDIDFANATLEPEETPVIDTTVNGMNNFIILT